jgi:hypothetical protein
MQEAQTVKNSRNSFRIFGYSGKIDHLIPPQIDQLELAV